MEPSSSILAPIQQLMATSRLVAASLRRPWSVDMRTLLSAGRVLLAGTALLTMLRPLSRFS